jgi:hypothetical protein
MNGDKTTARIPKDEFSGLVVDAAKQLTLGAAQAEGRCPISAVINRGNSNNQPMRNQAGAPNSSKGDRLEKRQETI